MKRNVTNKPVVLTKRNPITSSRSLPQQTSAMTNKKRAKFSVSDDDSEEAESVNDESDRNEDDDDEDQQSDSDSGKKRSKGNS